MRRKHRKWGEPEENSLRETLRLFMLYRYDSYDPYQDHVLRQRYLWLWQRGMMEMELSKEQVQAVIEAVQKMTGEEDDGEGDECNDCTTKQMEEKLKEINKPTKEKLSYVS